MSSFISADSKVLSSPSNNCNWRQHISRAPSSSLLGRAPRTVECRSSSRYLGIIDLVILRTNQDRDHREKLINFLKQQITQLPDSVTWLIATSGDVKSDWFILQTSLLQNHIDHDAIDSIGNQTSHSIPDTLSSGSSSGIGSPQTRQFSGLIRPSRSMTENPLAQLLTFTTSDVPLPAEIQRSRIITGPFTFQQTFMISKTGSTQHTTLSHDRLHDHPEDLSCQMGSNLTILREIIKTKSGQQKIFIESCIAFQQTLAPDPTTNFGLITMEVHQDLDSSMSGQIFYMMYYFFNDNILKQFRQSILWRRWRHIILSILDGPPIFFTLQSMFDTRTDFILLCSTLKLTDTQSLMSQSYQGVTTPSCESINNAMGNTQNISSNLSEKISTELSLTTHTVLSSDDHNIYDSTDHLNNQFINGVSDEQLIVDDGSAIVRQDIRLEPFIDYFRERFKKYQLKKSLCLSIPIHGIIPTGLHDLQHIHEYFGLRYRNGKWILREWIPNVNSVCIVGDFNHWEKFQTFLTKEPENLFGTDIWSLDIDTLTQQQQDLFCHKSKYKLYIETMSGEYLDRIPPSCDVVWKDTDSEIRNAIVWNPDKTHKYIFKHKQCPVPKAPKIYEAYIGLCLRQDQQEKFGTYKDFQNLILPRIHRLGYNVLLLLGISEHALTTLGWEVTNFMAPSSIFGTPEELKCLIDTAHGYGISVIISVVHSHASTSTAYGLNDINGTDDGFFCTGSQGKHPIWDLRLFDYEKPEICRFLLSQLSRYLNEFQVDGFRFEAVASMLFHHHGIGKDYKKYQDLAQYFSFDTNDSSSTYLMLANDFVHSVSNGITIGSNLSGAPTLGIDIKTGGLGFDFSTVPAVADEWITQLLNSDDVEWNIPALVSTLEHRPGNEKFITAAENWSNSLRSRRRLHIAMFAWESLHTHAVGGVAPHVTELSAGLARLGHEVHVFVRATGSAAAHSVHYGVHYHECPFQLNRDFVIEMQSMCDSFIWHKGETEAFLKKPFDICHAHDWLAARAITQAKNLGHMCIQTMHSTEYGRCGNKAYGGESKRISDIEREACHVCDRIICVSGVLANEVVSLFNVHPCKIQVVYNGINAEKFDGFEDAAPIKARYGISALDPMFLFVGRLVVQKGPDLLVEAIPHILKFRNDVKFLFVGDGHMKTGLIARTHQLGVNSSCRFTGAMTGNDLLSLFKAADAVVVPSRNEPFGIVVLEAWSAYKPVVATTCGGPRDFVSPHIDGLLVDPNDHSIAWGCCEILKSFDHSRWMGQRGRVKAAFNFSWNQIAKTTENVYYEQLNKHDSPPSEGGLGDCSLAYRLMGQSMHQDMGVFQSNDIIHRGIALHKIIRLLTSGLGSQGYLNFMGNEFGHPEYVDVPRNGNHFSFYHVHRQYHLADNKQLKYKHLEFFDACMIRLDNYLKWLQAPHQFVTIQNNEDKVIAFERGNCLFVANLHPTQSYEGYPIGHSLGKNLRIIFDTDDYRFGGFGRLAKGYNQPYPNLEAIHNRTSSIKLYLPTRTAMILIPENKFTLDAIKASSSDSILTITAVDQFLNTKTCPL